MLYPDVMVTFGQAESGDEQTISDPKLIIEVLSPSTTGYDKRDKFILYRSLASLRAYALIDPVNRQVEVFTLANAGAWLLTDQTTATELTLSSIGAMREDDVEPALALLQATVDGTVELLQPPHFMAEVAGVLARLKPQAAQQDNGQPGRPGHHLG